MLLFLFKDYSWNYKKIYSCFREALMDKLRLFKFRGNFDSLGPSFLSVMITLYSPKQLQRSRNMMTLLQQHPTAQEQFSQII